MQMEMQQQQQEQQAAAQQSAQQQIAQIGEAGIQYQQNQDLAEKQATVQQQQFDEQMAMYKAQTASGGGTAAGSITVPGTGATIDKSQVTTLNSLTTKASADITNIFNNPKLNEADLRQSWANSWNKIRAIFPVTVMSNVDIDNYLGVNGGWATLQSQYRNKYSSSTSSSSADKFDPNKTN